MLKFLQSAKLVLRLCEGKQPGHIPQIKAARVTFPIRRFSSSTDADSELDVNAITQGDPELEHKFKVLLLEVEVMRQEGRNIPSESFLKTQHWQEVLKLGSRSGRRKYLEFLFKIEKKRENEEIKKQQKRLERESQPREEPVTDHLRYTLGHNHIFLRFYDTTINNLYNLKLIEAIQFGQKLVVDCGYDNKMTSRENKNCAKQLMLLFSENRIHEDPFDLHFCNCNTKSLLMTSLHRFIVTMYEPWFPLNIHERSYTDIFPKEQLVYLTPHCKEEMKTYDHNAVYILGGIVDKLNDEPLSMAKAKQEGIRMLKLPLDRYLQWGSGSGKSLTLNQVIAILLDIKRTGDWKYALRHVPKRKVIDYSSDSAYNKTQSVGYEDRRIKPYRPGALNLRYNPKGRKQQSIETDGNRPTYNVRSIFND